MRRPVASDTASPASSSSAQAQSKHSRSNTPTRQPVDKVPEPSSASKVKTSARRSWDADYIGKDPIDKRSIMHQRINGGLLSPAVWSAKTGGYIGTDRMRHSADCMGKNRP